MGVTHEEAIRIIEKEIHIDVRCCTHEDACRFEDALRMAISALREQCVRDAAKTSGEAVTDSHQLETVTICHGLNCLESDAINRAESDTVKGVEIDQFNADQRVSNTDNVLTNAQRIRAMTDEELAEFWTAPFCNRRTTRECKVVFGGDCSACVLDWLKQLYKEES